MSKQIALVDFYNLHLQSGEIREDVAKSIPPDFSLAEELYYITRPKDKEKRDIKDFFCRNGLNLSLDESISMKLESWFDTEDFLEFTKDYRHTKRLVNEYINGVISGAELMWLNKKISEYRRSLYKVKLSTDEYIPVGIEYQESRYNLTKWKILPNDVYYEIIYNLPVGGMIHEIFMGLLEMLEGKLDIKHCAFEGGKRAPSCDNIFISTSKVDKYCSKKCYNKARRSRRYKIELSKPG